MREPFKEWVLESLRSSYSLLRIESQHFLHQVDSLLRSVRNQLAQVGRDELWEGETHTRGELVAVGPLCLSWASQHGACLIDLICFVITWEQRSQHVILSHHCPAGENIDR